MSTNTINRLQQFAYSPKKTRSKIKIEYDERSSNIKAEAVDVTDAKKSVIKSKIKTEILDDIKAVKPELKLKSEIKSESAVDVQENDESESDAENKKPKWEPKNWRQTLENIKKMRQVKSRSMTLTVRYIQRISFSFQSGSKCSSRYHGLP